MVPFFGLKLDTWPCFAILDLPFIARHPRRVLPTSFTGDVTTKLAGATGVGAEKIHFLCTLQPNHTHQAPRSFIRFIIACTFLCGFLLEYASCTPATSSGEGSSSSSSSLASSTNVIPASNKHKHLNDQYLISSRYQYKIKHARSTN